MKGKEGRQMRRAVICLAAGYMSAALTGCGGSSGRQGTGIEGGAAAEMVSEVDTEEINTEEISMEEISTERAGNALPVTAERAAAASALFQARNPYIGDASACGRLIGLVKNYYGIDEKSTFELQTEMPPYGLTLHFEEKPDSAPAQKAAAVLISLIDRCDSVSWDYPLNSGGNKEYHYLNHLEAAHFAEAGDLYDFAESETDFLKLLQNLESASKPHTARARSECIEEAVSAAIMEYNHFRYMKDLEVYGEGHQIMSAERRDGDTVKVYAQTMYGGYQFQNGNFVKESGSGVIPAVILLSEEPDGTFVALHVQKSLDGGDFLDSIKRLFPEELWEQCISAPDAVVEELKRQERSYAAEYLESIGREAAIGDYGDFPHAIPSDEGISAEVSNKIEEHRKYSDEGPAAYAPFWFGTVERLENGARYIYEHSYDPEKKQIFFSKIEFDTGEVLEQVVFDAETGEQV